MSVRNLNPNAPDEALIEIKRPIRAFKVPRDRVLIRPRRLETKLIIQETLAEKLFSEGTVVAIGEGGLDFHGRPLPPEAKVGDNVLFGKLSRVKKLKLLLPDSPLVDGKPAHEVLWLIDQDELELVDIEYEETVSAPQVATA